jgi:hypothetical protein
MCGLALVRRALAQGDSASPREGALLVACDGPDRCRLLLYAGESYDYVAQLWRDVPIVSALESEDIKKAALEMESLK